MKSPEREPTLVEIHLRRTGEKRHTLDGLQRKIRDRYGRWEERGIRTVADLLVAFPEMQESTRSFAIWTLGMARDKRAVPMLIDVFRTESKFRPQAAVALGSVRGRGVREFALDEVKGQLRAERRDDDALVHAVRVMHLMFDIDDDVLDLALEVTEREDLPAATRAQALETVGGILGYPVPRTERYERGRDVALRALEDENAEVRFWAIYALGSMGAQESLQDLRPIAESDHAAVPGWWTVGQEAEDVIALFETGVWPSRQPGSGKLLTAEDLACSGPT